MRTITLLLALTLLGGAVEAAEAPAALRVVSFNLYHGGHWSGLKGEDGELDRRLELVIRELRGLAPDVIGLQEASVSRRRGDVAARLAAALGYHWVHAPATTRVFGSTTLGRLITRLIDFREGPAIVSRYPIVDRAVYDLPRCGRALDARVLLRARIETPRGPLDMFSTHTTGDPCQVARVAELVRERRGPWPAVVMGDFNTVEGSPALAELAEAGFVDAFRRSNPEAPGRTVWQRIHGPEPTVSRRVDYIFLVPGTDFGGEVLASRVVLNTPGRAADGGPLWPSDHYGVFAEVKPFPPARAAQSD